MKLGLGTVQFGLDYGVANNRGRVSLDEAAAIIGHAAKCGIRVLDTAIGYGDSEQRLGAIGVAAWKVVTKLPACPAGCADVPQWVETATRESLARLGCPRLYGLMLHRPADLLDARGGELFAGLERVRRAGLVQKIGASVYDPDELDRLTPRFRFDLIQLPFNLFDDRFLRSGTLARLADQGIEVHARSIFLQGLLLMSASERPPAFSRWNTLWAAYDDWLRDSQMTALQACLRYALGEPRIATVLVGVDSVAHLAQILAAADGASPPVPAALRSQDVDLVNPSRWPR